MVYTKESSTFIEVRDFWYKRVAEKARNKPVIFLVKSKCDKDTKNDLSNDEMEFLASSGIQFQLVSAKDNLKIDESAEIEKILYNLSSMLFSYTNEIKIDVSIIGKLDFAFAKAKYSNSIKGITPKINDEKFANFINARHPLIDE